MFKTLLVIAIAAGYLWINAASTPLTPEQNAQFNAMLDDNIRYLAQHKAAEQKRAADFAKLVEHYREED